MIGEKLGPYEILVPLGSGGMGEVWKARDTRLGRIVAIKKLKEQHSEHFKREARSIAALNHPNICQIHDIGPDYLILEYVEGKPLSGPLPEQKAVRLAIQIAAALEAAHKKGIIHRDLKPSNIMVSDEGSVKLLDFGLAKLYEQDASLSSLPTADMPATQPGAILGTVAYMSPEQAQGIPADARSDIFSFGLVLYEMLSGKRAFASENPVATALALVKEEPPPLKASPPLERIVKRCLEKNPSGRYQAMSAVKRELEQALEEIQNKTSAEPQPSIAVLPFVNLSADPEQEFFCDGMAEEIINALAHLDGLRVIARTSSFAFKGKHEDIREIGSQLDVTSVLEGSVRKAGNRLRITAQLIDARDGSHLWSERYDRRLEDVFAIQDEISLAVVESLEVRLLGRERAAVVKRHTENLEAYNAYLRGLHHWNKLTPEGFQRSRECWERALEIEPSYAVPLVFLAAWYVSQNTWGNLSPETALPAATNLLERALAADDSVPELHSALGLIEAVWRRRWDAGERSLRRSVELGPNLAVCRLHYAAVLILRGRHQEALAETKTAQRLDPLSVTNTAFAASWFALMGRHEEAIAELERVRVLHPGHWLPHHELADALARRGDLAAARDSGEQAVALSSTASQAAARLACLCYMAGDWARGDQLFDALQGRARADYVSPALLGWVHLSRDEPGEATNRLEEAARIYDPLVCFTPLYSPHLFSIHPQVEALLTRILP